MADIELVIKISEEDYDTLINHNNDSLTATKARINLWEALKTGTPLPEHHSDLIERDAVFKCNCQNNFSECDECVNDSICNLVNEAPTIIPATKEKEEKQTLFDKMEEEFGKDWDAPKQTTTEEKSCATCGQPRDDTGRCILFKEGECVEMYEKWKPATKEEKSCLDCLCYLNTSACESCEGYSNYINGYTPKEGEQK